MGLELKDPSFRRHILVQCLILFDYLKKNGRKPGTIVSRHLRTRLILASTSKAGYTIEYTHHYTTSFDMENKRQSLTPRKRANEISDVGSAKKMTPVSGSHYMLKILLPNGLTVMTKPFEGTELVTVKELANRVRAILAKRISNPKKSINWDADLCFIDDSDRVYRDSIKLSKLDLNKVYHFRLHDGSEPATIYENMWDLTPDTELLTELPEEYTFETALADLIDNSLQAVWTNDENDRRLIRVEVTDDNITIFDTGPGMESIEKWGKMGASLHRAYKTQAIGGKPPYLKPAFGMFGYGGFVASMHLGRHTKVNSKTKNCKKVYMLHFKREALVEGAARKRSWTTFGGLRNPTSDELELSSAGSFTKVDIFEPKKGSIDIKRLKCKLKDIYFPYIQCDDLSKKGRTTTPIEFQVNGDDLTEIQGGEVACTNLNSCNGPEFVLQLRFQLNHENATTSSPGARSSNEANARLRCVYLPVKEGKESIESILETLKKDGYDCTEEFENFSHVSCRRLGRLLPDARWAWLPFMDLRHRKGDRSQVLKRSCMRVKCFIDTDAGFSPTPSKTDFAHQNPYTTALKNLGSKQPLEKGVEIDIRKDGKPLTLSHLDKQYQQWLLEMHDKYDEDIDCAADEPVYVVNPSNKRKLHVSNDVVRVHKAIRRKAKSWKSGQKIKILKGAFAGFHKNNVYATLEYILLEGFQGDAGGDACIICRTIDIPEEDGCLLSVEENPKLDLRKSVTLPINVIDAGKCVPVDDSEWNSQIEKQYQKFPSSIEILNSRHCCELGIKASLPDEREVYAGGFSPCEIVAVVRPATYRSGTSSQHLDQKYVMKDNFEMTLTIIFSGNKKSQDVSHIYSGRVKPSSQGDLEGLYIFQPKCKSHPLFQKAGTYTLTFSIRDSSCEKCVVKVRVKPSREVHRWALAKEISHLNITVGYSCEPVAVSMFDKFENKVPFLKVPELVIKVTYARSNNIQVDKYNPSMSLDKSALILEDLLIEISTLDCIWPTYDAIMLLCLPDGSHLLDIPIKVLPGPVKRFRVQPENFENQLIPGQVIKELTLELFDEYGNHLQENENVELSLNGFGWLDGSFSSKKVDACGFIDLGGLIRVTAGCGRNVSLSLCSNGELKSKEWQIEKRLLRTVSMIPEICFAGSQLENLEFEVVNSKGNVDVNFHDEDEIGQSHTLVIKSEFMDIDKSVKYAFRQGHCIVRAVPVPSEEGEYSFVAAHSRYPELQYTVKVLVEQPPEMEYLNIGHLSTNEDISPIRISHNTQIDYRSAQLHTPETNTSYLLKTYAVETDIESCLNFQKDLENEILDFGSRIEEHEEIIELLNHQLRAIEYKLSQLEVSRDQTHCIDAYSSPGKNEIKERVEWKKNSAAALVMKLLKELSDEDRRSLMGNIIGFVALLGTTPTLELSRIFAEYLGDQMLAVVCKSYEDVRLLETYDENGKLDRAHAPHMLASLLEQSINGRYLVLCIDDIRACRVDKDLQGKLLLADPSFPDGSTPPGFVGYAVNLIDIDVDHSGTKTKSGCGLRETLFYRLFGETQVYESREYMIKAIPCIKDGAVSLDGGILRGNGAISLGCLEPDILFPVAPARNEVLSQHNTEVMKYHTELMMKRKETEDLLIKERKSHESALKKFGKRRDKYAKYFTRNQSVCASSQVSPIACLEEKPVITQRSYLPTQKL